MLAVGAQGCRNFCQHFGTFKRYVHAVRVYVTRKLLVVCDSLSEVTLIDSND